jgi:hypothetical protein
LKELPAPNQLADPRLSPSTGQAQISKDAELLASLATAFPEDEAPIPQELTPAFSDPEKNLIAFDSKFNSITFLPWLYEWRRMHNVRGLLPRFAHIRLNKRDDEGWTFLPGIIWFPTSQAALNDYTRLITDIDHHFLHAEAHPYRAFYLECDVDKVKRYYLPKVHTIVLTFGLFRYEGTKLRRNNSNGDMYPYKLTFVYEACFAAFMYFYNTFYKIQSKNHDPEATISFSFNVGWRALKYKKDSLEPYFLVVPRQMNVTLKLSSLFQPTRPSDKKSWFLMMVQAPNDHIMMKRTYIRARMSTFYTRFGEEFMSNYNELLDTRILYEENDAEVDLLLQNRLTELDALSFVGVTLNFKPTKNEYSFK